MSAKIDLTGKTFGQLTVVKPLTFDFTSWLCRCSCGAEPIVSGVSLRHGRTRSCGCLRREVSRKLNLKHGHGDRVNRSPTYSSWARMLYRVRNEANQHYGGRGITVCKRWHKFENFLADMGERPEGKTLDRIDNSKGYSKPNCRWATQKEQCNNRRSSVHPTHNGKTQSLGEWSKELGIKYATLAYRWRKHKKLIL